LAGHKIQLIHGQLPSFSKTYNLAATAKDRDLSERFAVSRSLAVAVGIP
jgi:hypothetical protein